MNLFSALTDHLAPADVFLETSDRLWTFGDIVELSSVIGGGLVAAGVGAGDRVVVVLEKSAYAVALYLACLRIGAIFVPLNPAYTASEISYFVGDAKPAVVVATEPWPDMTTLILNRNGSGTLLQADHRFDTVVDRTPTDIAALLYTSGTTGEPKGAMLTHGCLLENARTLFEIWQWQPDDVLLHALPIFHVHGLFVALHCALLGGSRVVFLDRFDSDTVRDFLPSATVMMGVPTYYTRLLTNPAFGPSDCVNMRLFISGSAPLSEAAFFAFRSRTGHTILERYGMTEAGMICSNPYDGERLAGTVGFPLPRYLLRVADGHDQALPAGEVGILQIQGPSLFGGYWKRPEQTAESFTSDGYFRT
ncbi:MAG: AMP-binding protein, partial [Acidimicrobiia bacterium]|nr:AMP-binding protein [Acidimicrobiia bacterium]